MTSPEYLVRHARPLVPQDLQHHNCIRFRLPSGAIFGWSFEKNGTKLDILAEGSFITDDSDLVVAAVLGGMGISYGPEDYVTHLLASGRLVPLLEDWAPTFSGLYIYYSSRRQMPLPLKAFVEFFSGRLRRS